MSEPGREKANDIVRAARGLSPEAQDSFLKQACEGDAALRREVDSMLGATVVPGVESTIRTHLGQLSSPEAAGRAGEVAAPRQARYVFKGEVGRGGMGAVLKVFDTDLRRNLAMKVILGQEERTEGGTPSVPSELVDRFLEEAQVTGQLEHPGVVPVHELGVDHDGRMYFTMRLVRGQDFEEVIGLARDQREGWSLPRALHTLLRICETVAYAHSRRVLHRDLKPSNIMIGSFGETYVMDWGSARVLGREERQHERPPSPAGTLSLVRTDRREQAEGGGDAPSATQEGTLIGTPYYMPREQAAGLLEEIGPHSDVYAIGSMLYQLLTGLRPYEDRKHHRTVMEVIAAVMAGPPARVAEVAPSTPPELIAICEKAMAHDWRERYPNMLEMAEDLRAYVEGRVVRAYHTGTFARFQKWVGRNRALSVSLAASILLALTALVTVVLLQGTKLRAVRAEQMRTAEARDLAQANEREALRNAERARREGYVASVIAADGSLRANEIREAKRLLAEVRPELRGWEWKHLALKANSSLRALSGHTGKILSIAFHPDGRRVASSSEDGTVRVWDARAGRELLLLENDELVRSVAFSPDGDLLHAFGGRADATMRTWDTRQGELVDHMNLPDEPSSPIVSSPDGALLAFSTSGNVVQVVDAANMQKLVALKGHEDTVYALVFAPEGDRLLTASGDGSVRLWNVVTGEQVRSFEEGEGAVFSVAVHPDGTELVTGAEDGTVRRWGIEDDARSSVLYRHDAVVYGLSYDPQGDRVASVSLDKAVRVLHLPSRRLLTLSGHDLPVHCLAFGPDGRHLVTGGEDALILSWDVERGEAVSVHEGPEDHVVSVAVDPTGRKIVLGAHFGGTIELIERADGRVTTIAGADDPVNSVVFSPDGRRIAAGFEEEACVRVYDADDLKTLQALCGHEASITSVTFARDGNAVASGSKDYTVKVWSVDSGEILHDFTEHEAIVHAVAFHPRQALLAAAYGDGAVLVWDAESGGRTRLLAGHPKGAFSLAWSPDGSRLAVGAGDGSLWVWGIGDEEPVAMLKGHDQRISAIAFSPEGNRIVTGSYDTSLRIWDAGSWEPLLSLRGHDDWVTSVAFSPDGGEIVSGSFDNTLRTWRTRDEK